MTSLKLIVIYNIVALIGESKRYEREKHPKNYTIIIDHKKAKKKNVQTVLTYSSKIILFLQKP